MCEGFYTGRLLVELARELATYKDDFESDLKAIFGRSSSFLSRRHDVNTKSVDIGLNLEHFFRKV